LKAKEIRHGLQHLILASKSFSQFPQGMSSHFDYDLRFART
jgi:hypothetical protein